MTIPAVCSCPNALAEDEPAEAPAPGSPDGAEAFGGGPSAVTSLLYILPKAMKM